MKFFKMAVAIDQQYHGFKPFVRPPRCKLQSYSHLDQTMLEKTAQANLTHSLKPPFEFPNIHRSFSTPCLSHPNEDDLSDPNPRIEIIGGHGAPRSRALVVEVAIALASGANPEPVSSGLSGAYFLRAKSGDAIAVVKPIDEEPLAFNNPKGFAGLMLGQPGMKRSIRVGETGLRELAAYLLDHSGFAGVPPTSLVKIPQLTFHVNKPESPPASPYKIASLQRFVPHDLDAGDLGPSGFSVASIHRIGILDVRLLNLDRHAGNLLVKKGHEGYSVGVAELVPIDHGLCLPESLDDPYFEWLHWPQASIPFSELELDYISNLDPSKDAELLRTELPSMRESSIRVLILCSLFLKRAAAAGLSLAEIGKMMTREFCGGEENFSVLENLCSNAKATSSAKTSQDETDDDDKEEKQKDVNLFEFDNGCDDSSDLVFNVPKLLRVPPGTGDPQKIQRHSSLNALSPLSEENYKPNSGIDSDNGNKSGDNDQKVGGVSRSVSFPVQNHHNIDVGGISFEEMNGEEWKIFLEVFEGLLPEAFNDRKRMSLLKLRLGTSCKF
ncbi:hypothetical protein LguiB_004097 [Lonicera macranthoides]